MRGLIIDYARRRQAQKRGGQFEITSIATDVPDASVDSTRLTDLSEALDGLGVTDPRLARIVDLKYFCGFSFGEIAAMLGGVRADRPARLGKGPDLPAPRAARRSRSRLMSGSAGRLRSGDR